MRETENFKLKLPEGADRFSLADMNSNTELMDKLFKEQKDRHEDVAASRVMMVCGSYVGNGAMTKTISTPGIRPAAVLFHRYETREGAVVPDAMAKADAVDYFRYWGGEASLPAQYNTYFVTGGEQDSLNRKNTTIRFTIMDGGLSWTAATPDPGSNYYLDDYHNSQIVNNFPAYTYQWVAFGFAVE